MKSKNTDVSYPLDGKVRKNALTNVPEACTLKMLFGKEEMGMGCFHHPRFFKRMQPHGRLVCGLHFCFPDGALYIKERRL